MASPPTPTTFPAALPSSWGPLVDEDRALPVERAARLVAARMRLAVGEAADQLNALPSRHRYLLLEQIASTHRSVVYAAVDRALVREVAIKLHRDQDEHAPRRVMAEVRTMSELEHPNIVRVFDVDQQDGWLYSVTELCDQDMHEWCAERSWAEIMDRVIEAGCGLSRVHAAGFVHGDVKPTNILIKGGVAKLADFGFATKPRLGPAPYVVGTPGFIAPEVAAGERSPSGDVFALAASAWACLFEGLPFGTPPPRATVDAAVLVSVERAMRGELAQPKRTRPGLPRSIVTVIERGMHPDPSERPSLSEWLTELSFVLRAAERIGRLRRSWPAVVGGTLVLGLLSIGGYLKVSSDREQVQGPPVLETDEEPLRKATEPESPKSLRSRAEQAARDADGDAAVAAIAKGWERFEQWSLEEQVALANSATWVAEELERRGRHGKARTVWLFAATFHRSVGQFDEVTKADAALNRAVPPQSR
ncbi:Serine/threonine-protein kinase PrkC [Enhygromyxa salina]|uniref:Serine/threonine-protein kinase PrkC n=1 Tax=Enhygromyxa salina TaxID=215803 RepID=A0A2S9YBW1_9BACT|nr:serine/threonine-protein kinase [Enhygromyxa salina]PRQ02590.1 Serine/threonine-protein kinase PrkC [Enhygromyxa salina]